MATKREQIAKYYNQSTEWVCCEHCDRKRKQLEEKSEKYYCSWNRVKCANPVDDYCVYFLNTAFHK